MRGSGIVIDLIMFDIFLGDGEVFTFAKGCILSKIINNVKARKLMSKRCIRYLTHVMSKIDKSVLSL